MRCSRQDELGDEIGVLQNTSQEGYSIISFTFSDDQK
jgi:hypothetical protein